MQRTRRFIEKCCEVTTFAIEEVKELPAKLEKAIWGRMLLLEQFAVACSEATQTRNGLLVEMPARGGPIAANKLKPIVR